MNADDYRHRLKKLQRDWQIFFLNACFAKPSAIKPDPSQVAMKDEYFSPQIELLPFQQKVIDDIRWKQLAKYHMDYPR